MTASKNLRIALRALNRKRARSALILFTIAIGVATFTSMVALGDSNRRNMEAWINQVKFVSAAVPDKYSADIGDWDAFYARSAANSVRKFERLAKFDFNIRGWAADVRIYPPPGIKAGFETANGKTIPWPSARVVTEWGGGKMVPWPSVQGVTEGYLFFRSNRFALTEGRFITAGEVARAAPVCVISSELAERHFSGETPVGRTLRYLDGTGKAGANFEIVGVVKNKPPFDKERDGIWPGIYLPITRHLPGTMRDRIYYVNFHLYDANKLKRSATLLSRAALEPEFEDMEIRLRGQHLEEVIALTRQFYALGSLFGLIVFFSGGAGIVSVMLMAVAERRREIGVRRAVGARSRDVFLQFFFEALVLGLTGAALGAALGVAETKLAVRFLLQEAFPFPISMRMAVAAFAGCGAFCALFAALPAAKASRLLPAEILRNE